MINFDARDMDSLKLTVDQKGIVWKLTGGNMPRSTEMDIQTFMRKYHFESDDNIRIVGTSVNAPIIIELFGRRVRQDFASLEVCSPLCCLDPEDRDNHEVVLYSMRKFRCPPSIGGWHEFSIKDCPSYALSKYFTDMTSSMKLLPTVKIVEYDADYPKQTLFHHPAWPYLAFVEGLDKDLCAELIANILDPRWYIDPTAHTDDGDRLEQYLGLYPGISKETASTRAKRYQLVLGCWKNSGGSGLKADGPNGFIWRVWASNGGGEKGDIAACKCFVNYLRLTWTMSLCLGPQAHHLFIPGYFFSHRDEVEAFNDHASKINRHQ